MTTTIALMPRVHAALRKRLRNVSKRMYQSARWRNAGRPKVLFIVGCQRSGTTLMSRLFDADRDCRVFGEFSELSSRDASAHIRLNPLAEVAEVFDHTHAALVVAKPLVETQNIRTLLDYFPGSKALFMYRHFAGVAHSDLQKFGVRNGIDNLRPIAQADPSNWRSEGTSAQVRELVARFYSETMNPNDAAALFWLARNSLYFDLRLAQDPRVMLVRYEHFAEEPAAILRGIYAFVAVRCPELNHAMQVHSSSVRKGRDLELSPEVRAHCERLLAQLDDHYRSQQANGAGRIGRPHSAPT